MTSESQEPSAREQRVNEVLAEYLRAVQAGQRPDREQILARHPDLASELLAFFADQDLVLPLAQPLRQLAAPPAPELTVAPEEAAALPGLGRVRYFGDYELLEEIARGGMGVVFKARQVSLNRPVALKMILSGQLASAADVARFRQEAESAANLDHPNILPVYEVGEHQGQHYFSMKLIGGGSLTGHIAHLVKDPRSAVRLLARVARAVHHAHQRGILHRDLKPANILLDANGEPHVTDFGLARRVAGGDALTLSGSIVGTPSYMAPEQAAARKDLSTAVDVYSLGAILYELLTGRPPFRAETALDTLLQVMEGVLERPRAHNHQADRDLETICLKCLEKEPQRRYGSAEALAQDLERWLAGEPVLARRSSPWARAVKWARRKPALAALSALVVLVLAIGVTGVAWQWRAAVAARQEALGKAAAEETARKDAERARHAEADERAKAENEAYFARIALAFAKVDRGGFGHVEELLDACPPRLRHWEWGRLKKLCHPERLRLEHQGAVSRVAFSPDGRRLVTGSEDHTAKVWDVQTGKELVTLTGHTQAITSVAFPAAGRVVTESADYTARVWDAETGREIKKYTGTHVSSSADGRRVLTAAEDLKSRIWDTATGQEVAVLNTGYKKGGAGTATYGPFSPDGRRVLTGLSFLNLAKGTYVSTITVWDTETGKTVVALRDLPNPVLPIFSPDARRLLLTVVDVSALVGTKGPGLGFLLREAQSSESTVYLKKIFDTDTGKEMVSLRTPGFSTAAFSPDSKRVCTGTRIWNVESGKEIAAFKEPATRVRSVAFSADGKQVLTGGEDSTAWVWDAETGREIAAFKGHAANVVSIAFSPDGRNAATGSMDKSARLWDVRGTGTVGLKGHQIYVASAAFSPDGRRVVTGGWDKTAKVWDAEIGAELAPLEHDFDSVTFTAFSADGRRVLTKSSDLPNLWNSNIAASTWDLQTRRRIANVKVPNRGFGTNCLAFSPDGSRVVTGGTDPTARVWDAETGRELATLRGHAGGIPTVAFAPDGKRVVTAGKDKTVGVWDAVTGQETARFPSACSSLAVSPDGDRILITNTEGPQRFVLAGSGEGGPVRVWDTAGGQELLVLKGHSR